MTCVTSTEGANYDLTLLTPIIALAISIVALIINQRIAQRNRHLTIQQALFKTVSEKAKDCNILWEAEPDNEKHANSPHFKVMSELIISTEVIDKSISLFEINYKSLRKLQDDYYYLFWKQLRTGLRGWIRETPRIAKAINNQYYDSQVADLHRKFQQHFE